MMYLWGLFCLLAVCHARTLVMSSTTVSCDKKLPGAYFQAWTDTTGRMHNVTYSCQPPSLERFNGTHWIAVFPPTWSELIVAGPRVVLNLAVATASITVVHILVWRLRKAIRVTLYVMYVWLIARKCIKRIF